MGYYLLKLSQKQVFCFWQNYKSKLIGQIKYILFSTFGVLLSTFSGFTYFENEILQRTDGSCERERKYLRGFALKPAFNNEHILA